MCYPLVSSRGVLSKLFCVNIVSACWLISLCSLDQPDPSRLLYFPFSVVPHFHVLIVLAGASPCEAVGRASRATRRVRRSKHGRLAPVPSRPFRSFRLAALRPAFEQNGKSIQRPLPILCRPHPFLRGSLQGQVQQLHGALSVGNDPCVLITFRSETAKKLCSRTKFGVHRAFPQTHIQRFHRIGRIDHLSDFRRVPRHD
jgi:hypothetical protein